MNSQGDRIEVKKCTDPYTEIKPGTKGTVDFIDALGTLHCTFDDGHQLGLVPGEDEWTTLVHHSDPHTAIVSSKELGTNCWLAERLTGSSRCMRVWTCSYPEKRTCQAIHAEITYLQQRQERYRTTIANIDTRIRELTAMPSQ